MAEELATVKGLRVETRERTAASAAPRRADSSAGPDTPCVASVTTETTTPSSADAQAVTPRVASGHTPGALATPASPDEARFAAALERQFLADLERCTRQKHADAGQTRFSLQDILQSPSLAQAAWRELTQGRASVSPRGSDGVASPRAIVTPRPAGEEAAAGRAAAAALKCHEEMLHQLRSVAAIDEEMAAESRINSEMADLLLARLAAGAAALTAAQRFVGSLADAEQRMADGFFATRGATLACESDGAALHRLLATVTAVPAVLAARHAQRARELRNMRTTLAQAAGMFAGSRGTVHRGVAHVAEMMATRRAKLQARLCAHAEACTAAERGSATRVRCFFSRVR